MMIDIDVKLMHLFFFFSLVRGKLIQFKLAASVPIKFWNDLRQIWGELLTGLLGDGAKTESGSFLRVPNGVVIGQVHEFVNEIRLVQIGSQRAQFTVR